jgi:hypothetical protein
MNCISTDDYLGNTFTDPILRASFLRAAHRPELEKISAEDEAKRADAARTILLSPDPSEHSLGVELMLAVASRKMPSLALSHVDKQLPHLAALQEIYEALSRYGR